MLQAERLHAILEQLSGNGSVTVSKIAHELGVSSATVRRDLDHLEKQRLLSRTHGGAVSHGVLYELPLQYRGDQRRAEKLRIAKAASDLVVEGSTVGFTGGTTTTEVARALVDRDEITVVTNALNIASELAVRPNIKLVVTGGVARSKSYELVGPFAEETLSRIYLDLAFVAVDGISVEAGLTTHHEVEAHTNRALIERARRVVVVADSSKIGRVTFAQICDLDRVQEMITDAGGDPDRLAAVEEAGLKVTRV